MASVKLKVGGSLIDLSNAKANLGGTITQGKTLWLRQSGVLIPVWNNEIVAVATNATNLNVSSLFDPTVWASSTPKRLVIPAGVTIGSNLPAVPALVTGTGRGGLLTVENNGNIYGAGGTSNSGRGGDAFRADQACTLLNNGLIYAGGGGGGAGGAGGGGYYTAYVYQSGSGTAYRNHDSEDNKTTMTIYWNGAYVTAWSYTGSQNQSSRTHGGWYYWWSGGYGSFSQRRSSGQSTYYTSGGSGGNGGRGQGYDGANQNGTGGSGGGTNAGSGGTGGTGGGWAGSGTVGNSGGNGNNGSGQAGASGGLAGHSLLNVTDITLEDNGSILGYQA